jgi:type VI secretion system protein ImpI/type VI secretion system protein
MTLTLTILRCPPSVAPEVRQVGGGEYSIGRGPENDWVLPDPEKHLSKRHCVIAFRRGEWQVAGLSTNGTFVNRDDEPLESGPPRPLGDGDRLRLGSYEIEVRMEAAARSSWSTAGFGAAPKASRFGDDPFGDDPFAPAPARPQPVGRPVDPFPTPAALLPDDFDPLGADDAGPPDLPSRPDHMEAGSDAMPFPIQTGARLPDDWDLDGPPPAAPPPDSVPPAAPSQAALAPAAAALPAFAPPPVAPPPVAPTPVAPTPASPPASPPAAATAAALLAAFLRGAGMEDAQPADPEAMMERMGEAFRALVAGLRLALIARADVKREFRIEATEIRTRGNNLLKFSANDDDALAGLLGIGRRTDMSAADAVADALEDIRLHELATMIAMQNAVRSLVARLGPEQLRQAGEQAGGLALPGARKARAWDAFEALHATISRGLSDDFDSVFGKSFARAYEQASEELATRKRRRGGDGRS